MSTEPARVAVLGAGSWGTALALQLCRAGHRVRLWSHSADEIAALVRDRENKAFLPGVPLPNEIEPVADLDAALRDSGDVLLVVPSHAFADVVRRVAPRLGTQTGIAWATKGLDPASGRLLHEVARDAMGSRELAVISGPSFAGEVAAGLPTAVAVASPSAAFAQRIAALLHGGRFRTYTNDDIVGVEVGGATKNVLAIATGIADGLGFGANARAALITRGLNELIRLGTALGGKRETFMGLAGLGDLILTCTDDQSRNRRMGLALARGLGIERAKQEIGQEVEGVITAKTVWAIAQQRGLAMPIAEQVYRVIYQGAAPSEAAAALLERASKAEIDPPPR